MNRFLKSNIAVHQFITFFYCLIDADKKSLMYAGAGHNPPILVRSDGSRHKLDRGGIPLGILENGNYQQDEVALSSGDRILLFTDGVTEAMNEEEEEFGEERLIELLVKNRELSAAVLQKLVIDAVDEFSRGVLQDDVTVVVISVT